MRKKVFAFMLAFAVATTGISFSLPVEKTKADEFYDGWKLQWSEEFNGNSLDENVWNVEVNGYGGWNNELQYYTDKNHSVSDGTLKITAQHETYQGMNYTSTRINSENKIKLGNGRVEARIKLPIFKGTFPAFWLMGNNGKQWPECGEIDIMETVNTDNIAYGTAHWPKNVGTGSEDINSEGNGTYGWNLNLSQWHTYGIERDDTKIVWYVDGRTYHTVDLTTDATNKAPLKLEAYIILNLAIGGNWPGFDIDDNAFPATMEVDYVRYYVKDSSAIETTTQEVTTQQETTKAVVLPKVDIDGYQISYINKGLRTVYTVEDEDNLVDSSGLIYGYGDMNSDNMIIGSTNAYIHSYESTINGLLPVSIGGTDMSKSYAMTMKFIDTKEYYNAQFYIRPYLKLKDGTYVYGEVYKYNVYSVAEMLYKNGQMANQTAHNYVYDSILRVVNPSYEKIDYDWNSSIIK